MQCTSTILLQTAAGCREGFPQVRQVLQQVVNHLKQTGPETTVDVDALCSGAMWDAIGDAISIFRSQDDTLRLSYDAQLKSIHAAVHVHCCYVHKCQISADLLHHCVTITCTSWCHHKQ